MIDESQLVNTNDAAKLCNVTRRGFYYLLARADAPSPIVIHGKKFYWRDDVKHWNKKRTHKKKGHDA